MKKILISLLVLLVKYVGAQTPPEAFNYSGVARNAQNNPLENHTIGVQFDILKGAANGPSVYTENHVATTDAFGVFDLVIGTGAVQTGVFSNIVWSNDKYFLSVSLDTLAGTNFILMGTTQLLSVPYALYAKSAGTGQYQTLSISNDTIFLSPNGGFVKLPATTGSGVATILLTGNITDAQALAQIQQEFGPGTKNIYILNTTLLTTASFNSLTTALEIKVENNVALQSVYFNGLTTTLGKINIYNNSVLQNVSFPSLTKTYEDVSITANTLLQSISFPVLETATKTFYVSDGTIHTVNLSSLKLANGGLQLRFDSNSTLTTLDLPLLQYSKGLTILAPSLSSFNVPSLKYINGNVTIDSTALTYLSFPVLDTMDIQNTLWIAHSPITDISMPSLSKITYEISANIYIYQTLLTSINFLSALDPINYQLSIYFISNKLTSANVNSILAWAVLSLYNPSSLDLSQQTPPAPPTGQGQMDKQTLINNGVIVTTD